MKLEDNLSNLNAFLASYDKKLSRIKADVRLDGVNLERACMEQTTFIPYYDQIGAELAYAIRKVEVQMTVSKVAAIERIVRTSGKNYGPQMLEKMAEADPVYVANHLAYIELRERYDRAEGAVKALDKRGFALANIVKININALRDITIHGYDDD